MRPPSKYPATGWQAPHQGLVKGGEPVLLSVSPGDRLPNGGEVHICCHPACKVEVQEVQCRVRLDGAGEVNATLTPAATTPRRATAKAWIAESDRRRAARPVAGVDWACCAPSPCGRHYPGWKSGVRGGGGGGRLGGPGGGGGGGMCSPPPVPGNQNFARGSPVFAKFSKFVGPIALSDGPPIMYLPPPLFL